MTVLDGPRRLDDLPPVGAHVIGGFKGHRVVVDFRFLDRLEHSVDVHPSKPNIVYACTASHGLWCSQDRGNTWKFMEVPHFRVSHVKVDPANPELIYVTTFGGGTWRGYYLPE